MVDELTSTLQFSDQQSIFEGKIFIKQGVDHISHLEAPQPSRASRWVGEDALTMSSNTA